MFLYLGADHRGFELKQGILAWLKNEGYQPQDIGNSKYDEDDDYPDWARQVGKRVAATAATGEAKGIVLCGSGVGVDIVVNKIDGVRSVLGFSTDQVFDARQHDDVNILSLSADFLNLEQAQKLIEVFLRTPFDGEEKNERRINKIKEIERNN